MSQVDSNSVTGWIADLRHGRGQAACELWKRFSGRIVQIAKRELEVIPRRGVDEEDVALSVFNTVFRGVSGGRYSYLQDRTQLWFLLVKITRTKANGVKRHELRLKRGGKRQVHAIYGDQFIGALDKSPVKTSTPTAAEAAEIADELAYLMELLRDDELRFVAQMTLDGYSTIEIAAQLGVVDRSVRRKLRVIRDTWELAARRLEAP